MNAPKTPSLDSNEEDWGDRFLVAVRSTQPVRGLTHNYYRYPARFSPLFARAAIEAFSQPGDVVLDPFMGGATTLVEARALGRHAIGSDINSLSVFLSKVKTTPLSEKDLERVKDWVRSLPEHLNLRRPALRAAWWQAAGYQRNLPWPIRKTIEMALARLHELPHQRQQRFARCLLLKAGQWALDCREHIPSAKEFRFKLSEFLDSFINGMREYRQAVRDNRPPGRRRSRSISIHRAAAELAAGSAFASLPKKPTLVVTSPPYPGVHVLYHRWNVQGRRESPAPFWVANCQDGQGASHYTFGDRKQQNLVQYFQGIRESFASVRAVIDRSALVVQMVAFSDPDWQIPRFLEAMQEAGFDEVSPEALGIPVDGRLWRSVPGRRWFALIRKSLATSKELVLFHRPRPT
ncbi:MAG: site-specific DNA-methyltransferase [Thermogutta sp.]|nr:site-specific DNA-methyltransferase [Thermogutta sp.]